MQNSIFHKLSNVLWGVMVTAIVVLAIYVSLGRVLSDSLGAYQEDVLAALNDRVPFHLAADDLSGQWRSFTPEIVLSGLRLTIPGDDAVTLDLSGGRVGLDVLESLLTRSLKITSLQLDNLALNGELTAGGRLVLPGLTGNGGQMGAWIQEFLLNIEYVTLRDNSLSLLLPSGEQRKFDLNLHLAREGSSRRLRADLVSASGTHIELAGRGVGDPFELEQFTGELYLALNNTDLGAVRDVLATPPSIWAQGTLDSELWLSWDRGEPSLDFSLQVANALVTPQEGEWSIPLDELSLKASLVERRNRWTLFVSDLVARRGAAQLLLPRLQLDAWGESLRVRTGELQLASLNQLALELDALPDKLAAVFDTLQPAGTVSALQISVENLSKPAADWAVEANFEGVEVQSWRGAPGVTSGSGYVELAPGGGFVVLDSQQFTLNFPTVYHQPLYYDDFFGTLNLSWDSDALLLDSGVINAHGVEGKARALFRLNIPFSKTDVGLEMDLMVGLLNSHPIHRSKYLPYTLSDTLLKWLSGAIGEGDLDESAFVWRGSLSPGAGDLRTVQLFLNVANTSLNYHPRWPGVQSVEGVVLIDDTSVSVWAESARLYDSIARRLSVETWLADNGQMMLSVEGELSGSAADGLRAVNESLLGELVGGTFDDWHAGGELETRLQLELNLADKADPPIVDVHTRWTDVDLQINPGKLSLAGLSGILDYSSAAGFSSQDLQGMIWGESVTAEVSQRQLAPASGGTVDFSTAIIEVALSCQVGVEHVQQWLDLPALSLASGKAAVAGTVSIEPGKQTSLALVSDLVGVSLDLPPPWATSAQEPAELALTLPLGGEHSVLELLLGNELALNLDITAGELRAASLGIGGEPPLLEPASVLVTGESSLVDVTGWLDFVDRYLLPPAAAEGAQAPAPDSSGLRVQINDMHARRLQIWGMEAADVSFSLDYGTDAWEVRANSDWLRGSYRQPRDSRASLLLEYAELEGLNTLVALQPRGALQEAAPLDLPAIDVRVSRLLRHNSELGHIGFAVDMEGSSVLAREITGELAGMRLTPQAPASLAWQQGPNAGSRLDASLEFDDFGSTLEQLGYVRFLESTQGQLDLALQWPGAPQDFALVDVAGSMVFDIEKGRFLETPAGATGALKVVSILNLVDILQSLSLSHMFESGISFHSVTGEVLLREGVIDVTGIDVEGASSGFSASGVSNIAARSLDGELVATLPVANNLPWVAALAAGLPVAAGVFVVSKVFEKQVNRLSSGVYSISGTWDEPEMAFERIFDDASRQVVQELLDPNALQAQLLIPRDPNEVVEAVLPDAAQESQDQNKID